MLQGLPRLAPNQNMTERTPGMYPSMAMPRLAARPRGVPFYYAGLPKQTLDPIMAAQSLQNLRAPSQASSGLPTPIANAPSGVFQQTSAITFDVPSGHPSGAIMKTKKKKRSSARSGPSVVKIGRNHSAPLKRAHSQSPTKVYTRGRTNKTKDRYCRVCGMMDSLQWRRGPDGNLSLCNACGLHFLTILRREGKVAPKTPRKVSVLDLLQGNSITPSAVEEVSSEGDTVSKAKTGKTGKAEGGAKKTRSKVKAEPVE